MACSDNGCLWWCVGSEWITLEVHCGPGCDCATPTLPCSATENQNAKITFPCEGPGDPVPEPTDCDLGHSVWRCLDGVWELISHDCGDNCEPAEPSVACVEDLVASGGCVVAVPDTSSSASTACEGDCPDDNWRNTAELVPGTLAAPSAPCGGICDIPELPGGVADTYRLNIPTPTLEAYADLAGQWDLDYAGTVGGYPTWTSGNTLPTWTLRFINDESSAWDLTGVTGAGEEVQLFLADTFDPCGLSAFAYATHTVPDTTWTYPLAVGTTADGPCECCDESDSGNDGGDDADCYGPLATLRTYKCVAFTVMPTDGIEEASVVGAWNNDVGGWVGDTTFVTVDGETTPTLFRTVNGYYVRLVGESRTWYAQEISCGAGCRFFAADIDPTKDTGSGYPEESSDSPTCDDHSFRIRVCCTSCDVYTACCPNPIPRTLCVTVTPPNSCCDEPRAFTVRYDPYILSLPQTNTGSPVEGWVSDWLPPLWCGVDDYVPRHGETTSRATNMTLLGWRFIFYCSSGVWVGVLQAGLKPCPNNLSAHTIAVFGFDNFDCDALTGSGEFSVSPVGTSGGINWSEVYPCAAEGGTWAASITNGTCGSNTIEPVPNRVGYCDCEYCLSGAAFSWIVNLSDFTATQIGAPGYTGEYFGIDGDVTFTRYRDDAYPCFWAGCIVGIRVTADSTVSASISVSAEKIIFQFNTSSCFYEKTTPYNCCADNILSLVPYTSVPSSHPSYCSGEGWPETVTIRSVGVCDTCDGSDSGDPPPDPVRFDCVAGVCTEVPGGPYTSALCAGDCEPVPPISVLYCYTTIEASGFCAYQFSPVGEVGCLNSVSMPQITGPGVYTGVCAGDTYKILVTGTVEDCADCADTGSDSGSGGSSDPQPCCADCIVPDVSIATITVDGGSSSGTYEATWHENIPGSFFAGDTDGATDIGTDGNPIWIKPYCSGGVWFICWGANSAANTYCWTSAESDCGPPTMSIAFDNGDNPSPPSTYGPGGSAGNPVLSIVITTTCVTDESSTSGDPPPPPPPP